MARPKRLKLTGEEGFFYITSRTVGQEFLLGDVEKENLFNVINYYSGYYFIKPIGLTVMDNHFHLLIKSEPESYYSENQVIQRIAEYREKNKKKEKAREEDWEGEEKGFSYGMVIGSKKFLKEAYAKFTGEIIRKKGRSVYQTGINRNILSLRRLTC
jgi:hypothetical protein